MSISEVIAILVAMSGCLGVYFQGRQARAAGRQARAAEAQLASQLHSLGEVVQRLEEERRARKAAIWSERTARADAIKSSAGTLHDSAWKDHCDAWNHATTIHALQCCYLSRLSVAVSLLVGHQLSRDSPNTDPITERTRLLVVNGLAHAVGTSVSLEADYAAYLLDARQKGEEIKRIEEVFGEKSQSTLQQMDNAWAALSLFLEANKSSMESGA